MEEQTGVTDTGKLRFGRFLTESYEAKGFTQEQCVEWIKKTTKLEISISPFKKLASGRYDRGPSGIDAYAAITRSGLLRHKDETPYTLEDVTAVLCEEWDPFTDKPIVKKNINASR